VTSGINRIPVRHTRPTTGAPTTGASTARASTAAATARLTPGDRSAVGAGMAVDAGIAVAQSPIRSNRRPMTSQTRSAGASMMRS
jgi:hypothetical protein